MNGSTIHCKILCSCWFPSIWFPSTSIHFNIEIDIQQIENSLTNLPFLKWASDLLGHTAHFFESMFIILIIFLFLIIGETKKEKTQTWNQIDKSVKKYIIHLPPLSVQIKFVAQIEAEQEMVNPNKKLIELYEQKVKDKIGEVWGEESEKEHIQSKNTP